ncbi:MAG TPA: hypothetical protein VM934_18255 [Pyrinomonadaceae bacterium]|nr:hypothetical protein [Pyrinomonadaceae bacterium]
MYRPNFCAECGVRVERVRWRVWTSRRFCPACARRFRKRRIALPLLLAAGLAGTGYMLGRTGRPATPPLIVERGGTALAPLPASGAARPVENTTGRDTNASPRPRPVYGPDGTDTERPTDANEVVSICGARTKKGTPCQRRVRGTGRCWQHRGKSAMLPASKLIVPG